MAKTYEYTARDVRGQLITGNIIAENEAIGSQLTEEGIDKLTELRLDQEIKNGIQTIQYQLITLMTCNGQAPFVNMFMYLDEVTDGQTRKDLAKIIK